MTTRRYTVIGITFLALASSSGLGFAAGDERGNRALEEQTVQLPGGASVKIVRGRPSSPRPVQQAVPPAVPVSERWLVGGGQLWIVDPQLNKITVCFVKRTSYVGESYIECLSRD